MPPTPPLPPFGDYPPHLAEFATARVALLPVPYDATSTWGRGADRGPRALLEASYAVETYDSETDSEPCRVGLCVAPPVTEDRTPDELVAAVRARAEELLAAGKYVVTLGGNHTVSIGAIDAHRRRHPGLSVLQLDAHADYRDTFKGSAFNHACIMARAAEWCPVTQVGIRSVDLGESARIVRERIFYAADIQGDAAQWSDAVIATLGPEVYLTLDLDVFDPSIMPSTGTPEPGGLLWYPVLHLLRRLAESRRIVGFDVVELCPNAHDRSPDYLAAKLVYKILAYVFSLHGA